MRNDARPIGERFRDIADRGPRDTPRPSDDGGTAPEHPQDGSQPLVTNRDPGDEDRPSGESERGSKEAL
jgi:hypothetical protein